jgi:hypothetical protein
VQGETAMAKKLFAAGLYTHRVSRVGMGIKATRWVYSFIGAVFRFAENGENAARHDAKRSCRLHEAYTGCTFQSFPTLETTPVYMLRASLFAVALIPSLVCADPCSGLHITPSCPLSNGTTGIGYFCGNNSMCGVTGDGNTLYTCYCGGVSPCHIAVNPAGGLEQQHCPFSIKATGACIQPSLPNQPNQCAVVLHPPQPLPPSGNYGACGNDGSGNTMGYCTTTYCQNAIYDTPPGASRSMCALNTFQYAGDTGTVYCCPSATSSVFR